MAEADYCTAVLAAWTEQVPKCMQPKWVERHFIVICWRTVWHLTFYLSYLSHALQLTFNNHQTGKNVTLRIKQNSQSLIFYCFVHLVMIYGSPEEGWSCSEMWPSLRRTLLQFYFPGVEHKSLHGLQGEFSKKTCPLFLPFWLKPLSQLKLWIKSRAGLLEKVGVLGSWTTAVCCGPSWVPDVHTALCQALKGTHFSVLCPMRAQSIMVFFKDNCISRRCLHSLSYNYRSVIMYLMMTPPLSEDKYIFS